MAACCPAAMIPIAASPAPASAAPIPAISESSEMREALAIPSP